MVLCRFSGPVGCKPKTIKQNLELKFQGAGRISVAEGGASLESQQAERASSAISTTTTLDSKYSKIAITAV